MEVTVQFDAPVALPPVKELPVPIRQGGLMGLRAGLDDMEKRKILLCRESNADRAARRFTG
jgi:hypothetical protein